MIRALLVTRDNDRRHFVDSLLEDAPGDGIAIDQVADLAAATAALDAGGIDVVLYEIGESRAADLAALATACADGGVEAPVLVLAEGVDRHCEQQAAAAGAVDALPWDALTPALLQRAIRYSVDRRDSERQLASLVLIDSDTGLPRQPLFWEILSLAVKRARRNQDYLAVLAVRLMNLDAMADTRGAAREAAGRVAELLRASDTVARFDADQLMVLVESMPRVEDIQTVAEKIIEQLAEPLAAPDSSAALTTAVGIALYPTVSTTAEGLVSDATAAMVLAMEQGGNTFKFA